MSKEIKFRAWDKAVKQWRYGSTSSYYGDRPFTIMSLEAFWRWVNLPDIMAYESIGQFTGLHDKQGCEIYEGDIVRVTIYGFGIGKNIVAEWTKDGYEGMCEDFHREVIGNIYENPELMGD